MRKVLDNNLSGEPKEKKGILQRDDCNLVGKMWNPRGIVQVRVLRTTSFKTWTIPKSFIPMFYCREIWGFSSLEH